MRLCFLLSLVPFGAGYRGSIRGPILAQTDLDDWIVGDWQPCAHRCSGPQFRSVHCEMERCHGPRPASQRECRCAEFSHSRVENYEPLWWNSRSAGLVLILLAAVVLTVCMCCSPDGPPDEEQKPGKSFKTRIVEVPEVVEREVVKEVEEIEERIVEVKKIEYVDTVVEVPVRKIVEKIIEVPELVDRVVEVEVPQITERVVEVPRVEENIIYRDVYVEEERTVEVPIIEWVDRVVEVPVVKVRENVVHVPQVQYVDKHVEVIQYEDQEIVEYIPKIEERIVEVPKIEIREKIVEVPQVEVRERFVEVPKIEERIIFEDVPEIREIVREVPKVEIQERVVQVPRIQEVERVVQVPTIEERIVHQDVVEVQEVEVRVPVVEVRERIVPVPVIQVRETRIEVPQIREVIREVPVPVDEQGRPISNTAALAMMNETVTLADRGTYEVEITPRLVTSVSPSNRQVQRSAQDEEAEEDADDRPMMIASMPSLPSQFIDAERRVPALDLENNPVRAFSESPRAHKLQRRESFSSLPTVVDCEGREIGSAAALDFAGSISSLPPNVSAARSLPPLASEPASMSNISQPETAASWAFGGRASVSSKTKSLQ
mmetsp:Transcript_36314/g.79295  ORF Transcript_36314/g.79295 Transcript_36314/m.79295 type:complete len:603 (+) Transcript_36314:161-1969(+)